MRRQVLTGATTYEIVDNYVPEFIVFKKNSGSLPTALRVTVNGTKVITDLDTNAMAAIGALRNYADPTATYIKIPLADGLMPGKNIQISVTASLVGDSNDLIFHNRNKNGKHYVCCLRSKIFQSSSTRFKSFGLLFLDGATSSDSFNVTMNDGLVHPWTLDEVLLETYETTNGGNTKAIFDNLNQIFKEIEIIAAADRYVTLMFFEEAI